MFGQILRQQPKTPHFSRHNGLLATWGEMLEDSKAITSWKNRQVFSIHPGYSNTLSGFSSNTTRPDGWAQNKAASSRGNPITNAEEKTLVRRITRPASSGLLATPALVIETAEEICNRRVQLASTQNTQPTQLALMAISKAMDTNSRWKPEEAPVN